MKRQARVLGIDDSEFKFRDSTVPIAGAVIRAPSYIEAVMRTEITVDGRDACGAIVGMVGASRYRDQLRLILIDGVTLGGFNAVDISLLYDTLGIPVATVTRERPDMEKMKNALEKHFADWKERYEIISKHSLEKIRTGDYSVYTAYVGIQKKDLEQVLRDTTIRGAIPEPLRIAHLIATAFARGESRGRA